METQEKKIIVVDYGLGNLFSVEHACKKVGMNVTVSSSAKEIEKADGIILPGVGAFGDAMNNLAKLDMVRPLLDFTGSGKPFLGVCLGMQLLFEVSEEFGPHEGLGLIKGSIKKFPREYEGETNRIPQIAWNHIYQPKEAGWEQTPLKGLESGTLLYFVHSFYADPKNEEDVLATTEYNKFRYCSGVRKNNVFGLQFHPEKSAAPGLKIYENFKNLIQNGT